jgi:hypothetical protein
MAHRSTEGVNAIAETVKRYPSATVSFSHGGKHQLAEIIVGAQRRKLYFASTPSCRHAHKNAARQARKILIELGAHMEDTCHR